MPAGRVVARDVEADGFAAQAHQLLVQHDVAVVAGQRADDEVLRLDRRQDPDHGEPRPARVGRRTGEPELVGELVLEVPPLVAGQRPGRQVELHVPPAELGLEVRACQGVEHLAAAERGHQLAVDEVELHLDTGHRLVTGERVLAQHQGERIETPLDLAAVALAVASTEQGPVDVLAHAGAASLSSRAMTATGAIELGRSARAVSTLRRGCAR